MCDRLWVCAPARNLNDGSISNKAKSTHLFWYTVSRICSNSSLVKEEVLSDSSVNSKIRSTNIRATNMYDEWFKKSSHAPRASSNRGRWSYTIWRISGVRGSGGASGNGSDRTRSLNRVRRKYGASRLCQCRLVLRRNWTKERE